MAHTVLVVDDSKFALDMTGFMLTSAGFKALTASSGLEALEILGRISVDAVIVDVNMPGMDGYTLTRTIRADNVFGDTPVVMVTTESEAKDMEKGFQAGVNAYLVKPVAPDEMVAQIRLIVGGA